MVNLNMIGDRGLKYRSDRDLWSIGSITDLIEIGHIPSSHFNLLIISSLEPIWSWQIIEIIESPFAGKTVPLWFIIFLFFCFLPTKMAALTCFEFINMNYIGTLLNNEFSKLINRSSFTSNNRWCLLIPIPI